MRRKGHRCRRGLPPKRSVRPDAVLLRRELRWTAATVLALGAAGYFIAGAYGATVGSAGGYLLQQIAYRLTVRLLWHGWWTRAKTLNGDDWTHETARISLRAFTLWMRTGKPYERVHIALWDSGSEKPEDDESDCTVSKAEIRIEAAHRLVARLDNKPLWCDNIKRRRLRLSLQRDEARLLLLATGEQLKN